MTTALSLKKGENLNLSKTVQNLSKIRVGLGWNPAVTTGTEFDLDATAFRLNSQNKVRNETEDFIFYNNLAPKSGDASIKHTGDNRTGAGDGDDETLLVNLASTPTDVEKIVFAVTIHEAVSRAQTFGLVQGAYIRIINDLDNAEIARFDLTEDAGGATAMQFGELYRHQGEWKFRALGTGSKDDLGTIARAFGVAI